MLDDVLGRAHDHRGDAVPFEISGDQTHGLVTDGSSRHQQRRVDLVLPAARQDLRRIGLQRHALAAVGRRAVEALGQREAALAAANSRISGSGNQVLLSVGRGVLAVVADVGDARVVIDRDVAGIDRVELGGGVVERARTLVALVGLVGRRRRDQRQRAVTAAASSAAGTAHRHSAPSDRDCRSPARDSTRACGACTRAARRSRARRRAVSAIELESWGPAAAARVRRKGGHEPTDPPQPFRTQPLAIQHAVAPAVVENQSAAPPHHRQHDGQGRSASTATPC